MASLPGLQAGVEEEGTVAAESAGHAHLLFTGGSCRQVVFFWIGHEKAKLIIMGTFRAGHLEGAFMNSPEVNEGAGQDAEAGVIRVMAAEGDVLFQEVEVKAVQRRIAFPGGGYLHKAQGRLPEKLPFEGHGGRVGFLPVPAYLFREV